MSEDFDYLAANATPPSPEEVARALVRGGFPDYLFDGAVVSADGNKVFIETEPVLLVRATGKYRLTIEEF